jgi:predicted secreted protein
VLRGVGEHRLGPQDAGRTVEVAAGDRLVLELPEIPGTGYTWEIDELPPGGRVIDEHYEQRAEAGIGGGSRHVFVVDPAAGGRLSLKHSQPWRGEEGVVDRYEVTAVVPS